MIEFVGFGKIPRYSREVVVTEKIDGTNGQIYIEHFMLPKDSEGRKLVFAAMRHYENFEPMLGDILATDLNAGVTYRILAGSKKRWLTKEADNFGFFAWVYENAIELAKLGPGRHFGEWWGQGIQRNYGLKEKRFSLFNAKKWSDPLVRPACCSVVPVLWHGDFGDLNVPVIMVDLWQRGSMAAPSFIRPEGIVIYHTAGNQLFKKTFENDEGGKGVE